MGLLFTPYQIGSLETANRLVRSATAERMADPDGRPLPPLTELYEDLTRGGVGLIITGHMYVHPSGKAHDEMTGIHRDDLVPDLANLAQTVHDLGGRIVPQINHGGMNSLAETISEPMAPSAIDEPFLTRPAREMTPQEVETAVQSFADAARRCQQAGFDGVQIHAAHGYLISQFLSPYVNQRTDRWGGTAEKRMRFLRDVCSAVREQVGDEYPVLIKLGMEDGVEGGLSSEEGAGIVAALAGMGIDAVEISGGLGGWNKTLNVRKGIKSEAKEAYFVPLAREARRHAELPILVVGGFRSRSVMEKVLDDGFADYISLCRPLISEPDLPNQFKLGLKEKSRCLSANNCWAKEAGEGISCKCPHDRVLEKLKG
ncbi:MAG: NADH:flavin oxidoreductase [Gemmatimonadetes bacterium]|nr:NADH:flavin oxidoreductase [Gemmatimonadota bacterium]NNM07032.1 NADH:flavin oxidoreductase [Gemmatimonadota bacterium]